VARLREVDVRSMRGVRITTPARTVADCLRRLPPLDAVALTDAALRRGVCSLAEVRQVLQWQAEWPFAAVGALALQLVDPRRESPIESKSAVVMHQHRVPPPEPQVNIEDPEGRFVARVDFLWRRYGVVGEVDGRVKYAGDAARAIEAEKDRQARLEALGLIVVRWDARHLFGDVPVLVQRVMTALSMGDGRRFRGRAA
jgi:very-short-patch-repair endonuclease